MNALVIGGAGFIGANVARRHLARGHRVTLFDNLSRRGSRENLLWLTELGGERLRVVLGDVARDTSKLRAEVEGATVIYHLAGQVAVTTSLKDPRADHEANLVSTLEVLEAMRTLGSQAPLLFASTNKVYGGLDDLATELQDGRWSLRSEVGGIGEERPLDFHSPYGCSKGAADQYVRDYARVFGLRTLVFRQSCVYGPRQFGVEDQGWLVHFMLAFAFRRPITVFGDGRQVRDALYVEDLVDLFELAAGRAEELKGEVFNVGGGPANRLSILELIAMLESMYGFRPPIAFGPWRQGDQKVFVASHEKAERVLGWVPRVSVQEGLERTADFVRANPDLFTERG